MDRQYANFKTSQLEDFVREARTEYIRRLEHASHELKYRTKSGAAKGLASRVQRELDLITSTSDDWRTGMELLEHAFKDR